MLRLLRDKLGYSVVLSVVDGDNLQVMESYGGDAIIDIPSGSGAILPPHASAQGKILLAFGGGDPVGELVKDPLHSYATKTIVAGDTQRAGIETIRHQGRAKSDEE